MPGTRLAVRVTPRAARNRIARKGDTVKVWVTTVPEDGKANAAVQKLLAKALGIPKSRLSLDVGATARDKVFLIED